VHILARDWTDYAGLHWRDLSNWATAVLVLAAVATVVLARQTVTESQEASTKLGEVVDKLADLVTAIGIVSQATKETAAETRNAALAARETVAETRNVVAASKETAVASAQAATAIRQTIEILAGAREDDRRYRQLELLRASHRLVLAIERSAQNSRIQTALGANTTGWTCAEQAELKHAIAGSVPELPRCRQLAAVSGLNNVTEAAGHALAELAQAFRSVGAEGG
jgi:hypothetical protein